LIHRAGGIAVLAHPLRTGVDELLEQLPEWGLGGLETYTQAQMGTAGKRFREYGRKHGLVCAGGSDFHGSHSGCPLGSLRIPYSVLDELRLRLEKQRADWI
jgi:predicted metal-dependent phosphoesterase TrpH